MDVKLQISKQGLSTTESVINEEFTLRYGHIFRGPKGDSGEKGETGAKGDNGKSPKVSETNTWLVYDDELKTYVDTGIKASGSDNNYSDADKALVQTIPNKVDEEVFDETVAGFVDAINDVGTVLSESKANKDGYYPDMTVGKANNLVGRGDTQEAYINFRPSGGVPDVGNGMNISDGAARISAIKGNSVVYNQQFYPIAKNGWSVSYPTYASGNLNDGAIRVTVNDGVTIANVYQVGIRNNNTGIHLHRYLIRAKVRISAIYAQSSYNFVFEYSSNNVYMQPAITTPNEWVDIHLIFEGKENSSANLYIKPPLLFNKAVGGDWYEVKDATLIDLTKMFSAGNEPTSYEEYLQRKPINIDNEFAYKEGKLIDMKVDELVSTGDNAYNPIEHKARVIGGQKYHITDSANTEDLEVTFYAFDEDENEERVVEPIVEDGKKYYIFPANGYCIVNGKVGSVCVCLEHSYEKPIKPYEVNVKDLSFIEEIATEQGELLFTNGLMRSAGSAYDEIRYNVTTKKWEAIKRMGVIDLGSLDWKYEPTYSTANFKATVTSLGFKKISNTTFPNMMCVPYDNTIASANVAETKLDKTIKIYEGIELRIQDFSYTDAQSFKEQLQGVILNYELAKPIEVEIPNSENWNLDYMTWDFGTEEALVRDTTIDDPIPSAPFRAEINYEPNAVDDLRWSIKYIRALEARVLALEQKVVQETNIEEV